MKRIQIIKQTATVTLAFLVALALVSGAAFAQGPGFGRGPGGGLGFGHGMGLGPGAGGGFLGGMMAAALDLTDAQKEQIRAIHESAATANQAILDQLKPIREQELAAIKAGKSEAELRSLANSAAPLMAQLHANQLVAHAKIYQVLTPEQREKLDKFRAEAGARARGMMQRRGPAQF
jgi:Spy/CpxP family protein refolding chaperone